jgi:hypothetical protein
MKTLFDIQYRELKRVIKPYKKDWNEWTISSSCFLERNEIALAERCMVARSYSTIIKNTDIPEAMLYITMKNTVTKLILFLEIFKKYEKLKKIKKKRRKKTGN